MFNEAERLDRCLGKLLDSLVHRHPNTQVILVDDGSTDGTHARAQDLSRKYSALRLELTRLPTNRGKGAAVREGMDRAVGRIRMFADADNATPIEELDRLLPYVQSPRHIVIASRDLEGSVLEIHQPWWREAMGRCFNFIVRRILGFSFRDTQCGFKLFGQEAAELCFSRQKLDHFAFDAELLWIAKKHGFKIVEVPVRWRHIPQSRVKPIRDSLRIFWDTLRIRWLHR